MAEIIPFSQVNDFATPEDFREGGSTQTFKGGVPLELSSNQVIEYAGSNPIAAISVSPASGTQATARQCIPAIQGCVFQGTVDKAGAIGTYALLATDQGKEYGLTKDTTTGLFYIDVDKTTSNARVYIISLIDPPGTVRGRVKFVITGDQILYKSS